jgi:hypothetical protein
MKRIITALAITLLCTGCKDTPDNLDKYTMDYSLGSNEYGVVVVEDDGITKREAEKHALQKAAEIAHSHGYRYFVINEESEVAVMKSSEASPSQDMPGNEYYKMIQSKDFTKDQGSAYPTSSETMGYRIEFTCQENKPYGKHYDACDFGLCND